MNIYRCLIVGGSGEDLALFRRNRRISLDELRRYAAQSFDRKRERSDIQKENVVYLTCEYARLDRCTDSHAFIRIDTLKPLPVPQGYA